MAAFFCTDLQATPTPSLEWVVMRWPVEVTFAETPARLGLESLRQWAEHALTRTTPVLLTLFSLVSGLALKLSPVGEIPVPITAWTHTAEPTFSARLWPFEWQNKRTPPTLEINSVMSVKGGRLSELVIVDLHYHQPVCALIFYARRAAYPALAKRGHIGSWQTNHHRSITCNGKER